MSQWDIYWLNKNPAAVLANRQSEIPLRVCASSVSALIRECYVRVSKRLPYIGDPDNLWTASRGVNMQPRAQPVRRDFPGELGATTMGHPRPAPAPDLIPDGAIRSEQHSNSGSTRSHNKPRFTDISRWSGPKSASQ